MAKKEETRIRIMKEALRIFSKQGYYQTTTKKISLAAEVNELTLFRHFGTKEKLFQETTTYYVEEINIKSEISRLIRQDFEESILEIARDYLDFCFKNKELYKIQMGLSDEMKDFVRLKLSRGFKKELEEYFTHLVEDNQIDGDPVMMSVVFINCMLGAFTVYLLTGDTFSSISIQNIIDEQAKQFASYYRKQ